jgi:hypothetical protein
VYVQVHVQLHAVCAVPYSRYRPGTVPPLYSTVTPRESFKTHLDGKGDSHLISRDCLFNCT